jgi:pentatricopeptide repeat protein
MTTALNTALGACFKAGQIPAAVELYDKSIATGIVTADIITYTTLMNTLASGMYAHMTTI